MATKTITIDVEAYRRLRGAKRANESFSQTIKRVVPKPINIKTWLTELAKDPAGEEFVAAVEQQVDLRRLPSQRER